MKAIELLSDISIVLDFLWGDMPKEQVDAIETMLLSDSDVFEFVSDIECIVTDMNLSKHQSLEFFLKQQERFKNKIIF